jgi:predicted nucleic acid-binding protein
MSAEYFLDTNVIVYAFDRQAGDKRKRALELMAPESPWIISWQVVQEFCAVALHRFSIPLDHEFLGDYLDMILLPHCRIMPSASLYREAVQVHRDTQYRYYDSLVVTAALASGASVLYSEDLQHGRMIGNLRIVNPFC